MRLKLQIWLVVATLVTACTSMETMRPPPSTSDDLHRTFRSVTPENFDLGGDVSRQVHLHTASYFRTATIARQSSPQVLELNKRTDVSQFNIEHQGGRSELHDYIQDSPLVDGMLVLHKGRVIYEHYPNMKPWQRHWVWSISKVIVSTTVASLVHQGRVNVEAPIERYLPEFAESAWAGTKISDIAHMSSGMDCLDADGYQVKTTCIYLMEETLGITNTTGYNKHLIDHLVNIKRRGPAGARNEYVTANTVMLSLLIEAVTDQPIAKAIQLEVWSKIGAEADALMTINREGFGYGGGGIIARLRDIARFGQLFVYPDDANVIRSEFVAALRVKNRVGFDESQVSELVEEFGQDLPTHAAWQWDLIWPDGGMFKSGYSGQGLYVDPDRELVITFFGTDSITFEEHELLPIARQLARSGLFE